MGAWWVSGNGNTKDAPESKKKESKNKGKQPKSRTIDSKDGNNYRDKKEFMNNPFHRPWALPNPQDHEEGNVSSLQDMSLATFSKITNQQPNDDRNSKTSNFSIIKTDELHHSVILLCINLL